MLFACYLLLRIRDVDGTYVPLPTMVPAEEDREGRFAHETVGRRVVGLPDWRDLPEVPRVGVLRAQADPVVELLQPRSSLDWGSESQE